MARRDPAGIRLLTRNRHDWAARYPLIREAVDRLKVRGRSVEAARLALHFGSHIDMWTDDGETILEHLASAEDFIGAIMEVVDSLKGRLIATRGGGVRRAVVKPLRNGPYSPYFPAP